MDEHCVSIMDLKMKDAGMRIRVEPELRDAFTKLCKEKDVPAAHVLRLFMREFVEKENSNRQPSLFVVETKN